MKKIIYLMVYFIGSTAFGAININGNHLCTVDGQATMRIELSEESLTIAIEGIEDKTYYFNKDQTSLFRVSEEQSEFAGDEFRDPRAVYRLTRRHSDRIDLMEVQDSDYGYSERVTIKSFRFDNEGKLKLIYLSGTSSDGHNEITRTPIICD